MIVSAFPPKSEIRIPEARKKAEIRNPKWVCRGFEKMQVKSRNPNPDIS